MQELLCHSVVKIHVKGFVHERLTTYTLISKKIKAHFQASFTAPVRYDFSLCLYEIELTDIVSISETD